MGNFKDYVPREGYGLIYRYSFQDGKSYIGQTKVGLSKRHRNHSSPDIYDVDAQIKSQEWTLEVLDEVPIDELDDAERYYIRLFNSFYPNGYNYTTGGRVGNKTAEVTKKKQSEARIGIECSEETKQRMSESHRGMEPWNKGLKGVMVAWNKGMTKEQEREYVPKHKRRPIPHKSEEEKFRNRSEAQKGHIVSQETRDKISASLKGRSLSEETRRKMRDAHKGRKRTPQEIANVHEGCRKAGLFKAVVCVETGVEYESLNEAERQTGVCASNISAVLKGRLKSAGGYHWTVPDSRDMEDTHP